ncbi:GTPase [Janibacter limosus]|uniref:50S ribosome-binding GTPase n=1 Tax=Janibacter limosus TaxID=53458 RepID=A0AC61U273_9MICO|nr:GTPase [Janibacter limosus]UUZ43887.1 GTPase [Janibacter limosus]
MSRLNPLRRSGGATRALSVEELGARADALSGALGTGGARLEPAPAARAGEVVDKVRERTSPVGGHTVVALAGATGSGKSSLFNALVGAEVARSGMRRPTTSTPTAAVWGSEPAGELLDWLSVGTRHRVEGPDTDRLDGLVLVDLPDFDSRESAHREEATRVLELVDVFVWVTDPQKYADAVLHDDYVAVLREYGAVTIVVLNRVDRLPAGGRGAGRGRPRATPRARRSRPPRGHRDLRPHRCRSRRAARAPARRGRALRCLPSPAGRRPADRRRGPVLVGRRRRGRDPRPHPGRARRRPGP